MPLALVGFLKWLADKLSIKAILTIIVLAVCAWYGFKGYRAWYDHVYQAGVASQVKIINGLKADVTQAKAQTQKAQDTLAGYKSSYDAWKNATQKAQTDLKDKNDAIVADLNKQIDSLNHRLNKAHKDLNDEVARFVSAKADATCILPTGFVLLYNQTIQADASSGSSPVLTVPSGVDADAPAGLSCTAAARILGANNLDAVKYRNALISWQRWYTDNQKAIEAYQALQKNTAPTPPAQ